VIQTARWVVGTIGLLVIVAGVIEDNGLRVSVILAAMVTFAATAAVLAERDVQKLRTESERREPVQHEVDQIRNSDLALLRELLDLLPSTSEAFDALQSRAWASALDRRSLEPLRTFERTWGTPEREFLTTKLEVLKVQLLDSASALLTSLWQHTFERNDNSLRIYPDVDIDVWDQSNQHVRDAFDEINQAADKVIRSHEVLVRAARHTLRPG